VAPAVRVVEAAAMVMAVTEARAVMAEWAVTLSAPVTLAAAVSAGLAEQAAQVEPHMATAVTAEQAVLAALVVPLTDQGMVVPPARVAGAE